MPMPSAYETRSEAFFRLYEGETPQEIQTLLTRWIPKGSRVLGKLFKNPCSQAELNKIVPFGFSLQRQKMVFFAIKIV